MGIILDRTAIYTFIQNGKKEAKKTDLHTIH
jgi:hypothetical protein